MDLTRSETDNLAIADKTRVFVRALVVSLVRRTVLITNTAMNHELTVVLGSMCSLLRIAWP